MKDGERAHVKETMVHLRAAARDSSHSLAQKQIVEESLFVWLVLFEANMSSMEVPVQDVSSACKPQTIETNSQLDREYNNNITLN